MLISLPITMLGHLEMLLEPAYEKAVKQYSKGFLKGRIRRNSTGQWAQNSQCSVHIPCIILCTIHCSSILEKKEKDHRTSIVPWTTLDIFSAESLSIWYVTLCLF